MISFWFVPLASVPLGFMFMNIPPVSGGFMVLFGVSYGGLSLFLSGLLWSHALSQVPAGLAVDRLGPWRSLWIALAVGALCNFLPFLAPGHLVLAIFLRFVAGLCTGLAFLAMVKIIVILVPAEKMTTVQGLQGAGFCLGTMMPYLVLPRFGASTWPAAYLAGGLLLTAALVCAMFLPRERLTDPAAFRKTEQPVDVMAVLKTIAASKPIWILGFFHGLSYGSLNNLGQWLPSILNDLARQDQGSGWATATMVVLLVGTAGRAASGSLARRFSRRRVINVSIFLVAVFYVSLALAGSPVSALGLGLAMALVCGATYGSIFTLSGEAAGPAFVATAIGFMNMIANLFNVALTLVFGYAREHTGAFSGGLLAAGLFAGAAWLAGLIILRRWEKA